jgi:hypothetical protein
MAGTITPVEPTFPTPAAAAQADDPNSTVTAIVKVEHSPDGRYAMVFLEHNGSEPYEQLCERTEAGWIATTGGSGGGQGWKSTHEDPVRGSLGVTTTWDPPSARWDAPPTSPDIAGP